MEQRTDLTGAFFNVDGLPHLRGVNERGEPMWFELRKAVLPPSRELELEEEYQASKVAQ